MIKARSVNAPQSTEASAPLKLLNIRGAFCKRTQNSFNAMEIEFAAALVLSATTIPNELKLDFLDSETAAAFAPEPLLSSLPARLSNSATRALRISSFCRACERDFS